MMGYTVYIHTRAKYCVEKQNGWNRLEAQTIESGGRAEVGRGGGVKTHLLKGACSK